MAPRPWCRGREPPLSSRHLESTNAGRNGDTVPLGHLIVFPFLLAVHPQPDYSGAHDALVPTHPSLSEGAGAGRAACTAASLFGVGVPSRLSEQPLVLKIHGRARWWGEAGLRSPGRALCSVDRKDHVSGPQWPRKSAAGLALQLRRPDHRFPVSMPRHRSTNISWPLELGVPEVGPGPCQAPRRPRQKGTIDEIVEQNDLNTATGCEGRRQGAASVTGGWGRPRGGGGGDGGTGGGRHPLWTDEAAEAGGRGAGQSGRQSPVRLQPRARAPCRLVTRTLLRGAGGLGGRETAPQSKQQAHPKKSHVLRKGHGIRVS